MLNKLPKVGFNKQTAIKTAIVAVVLLGLVGLVSAVGAEWHETKTKKAAEAQALVAKQEKEEAAQRQKLALIPKYEAAYQKERLNCERGKNIYDSLPVSVKRTIKVEPPTCGLAVPKL